MEEIESYYDKKSESYDEIFSTRALIWKFNCTDDYPYESLSSSPAVANGVVYVTSSHGNVFAIDASSGNKIWNHTTADLHSFVSSPVYCNGIVYTSTSSGVYALNASTGQEIWHSTPMYAQASPAIVAGVIYVGAGDGNIYALDALTGAEIWQYETGSSIVGQTSIAGGVIYVGTRDGAIYAIGTPQPSPEPTPSSSPTPSPSPAPSPSPSPTPSASPSPSPTPMPSPTTTPDEQPAQKPESTPDQQTPVPSSTILIVASVATLTFAGSSLLIYFKKRKH